MKFLIAAVVCLYVVAAAPSAMIPVLDTNQKRFDNMDTDMDGFVSEDELLATYAKYDLNGDGKVAVVEFVTSFTTATKLPIELAGFLFYSEDTDESMFIEEAEVRELFMNMDINNNGKIEFSEFDSIMTTYGQNFAILRVVGAKLSEIFSSTDVNNDMKLTPVEIGPLFSSGDANGDGKVSESEFVTFWMAQSGMDEPRTKAIFKFLDMNKDGYYASDDRVTVWGAIDNDKDGFVDVNEYNFLFIYLAAKFERESQSTGNVGY